MEEIVARQSFSPSSRRRRCSQEQKRAIVAEAFAPGASVSAVARRTDIGTGQIYRWRRELDDAMAGFAEVVVSPSPCERPEADAAAVEVALGADIRVRIPVTTPAELACAVIKAVVSR